MLRVRRLTHGLEGSIQTRLFSVLDPLHPPKLEQSPAALGCVVMSSYDSPSTVKPFQCPHLFVRRGRPGFRLEVGGTFIIEQECEICRRLQNLHVSNDGYQDAGHDDTHDVPLDGLRYNHRLTPMACSRRRVVDIPPTDPSAETALPAYKDFDVEHHRAAGWLPGIRSLRSALDALGVSPYFLLAGSKEESYEAVPFWLARNTYRLIDQFSITNVKVCTKPPQCPVGNVGSNTTESPIPYCEAFQPCNEAIVQNRLMRNAYATKLPAYMFPVLGTWFFFLRTLARVSSADRVNQCLLKRRRQVHLDIISMRPILSVSEQERNDVDNLLREGLVAVRAAGGAFGAPYEHAYYGSAAKVARMRLLSNFFRADFESNITALIRMVSTYPNATKKVDGELVGTSDIFTTSTPAKDGIRVLLANLSHTPFTPSFVLYCDENLKQIVLAFRGTHSDANVVTDVHNESIVLGYAKISAPSSGSKFLVPLTAARGFYCLVGPTASTIMTELDTVLEREMRIKGMLGASNPSDFKLIVTGHSLGGGQALAYVLGRLQLSGTRGHNLQSCLDECVEWSPTGVQDIQFQEDENGNKRDLPTPLTFTPAMLRSGVVQVHAFSPPPFVNGPLRDIVNSHLTSHTPMESKATSPLCSYVFEDDLVPRSGAHPIKEYVDAIHTVATTGQTSMPSTAQLAPEDQLGVGGTCWDRRWQTAAGEKAKLPETPLFENVALRRYLSRYFVPGDIALLARDIGDGLAATAGAHCFYFGASTSYFPLSTVDECDVDAGGAPLGLPCLVGPKGGTDHLLLNYHRAMLSVVKKSTY